MAKKGSGVFQAGNTTIGEMLFGNETYFRIPEYQRPYTWGEDEALDFWNDLKENSIDNCQFLGSFVFNKRESDQIFDIIDGQQRTLTITLFLAAIRNIAIEIGWQDGGKEIQTEFICKQSVLSNNAKPRYRVIPGETTRSFFAQIQDNQGDLKAKSKEEKKIEKVYNIFYGKIHEELDKIEGIEQKKSHLSHLIDLVINSECIEIIVSNETIAYTIFETVNARGADLSVSDLVKNNFFKLYDADKNLEGGKKLRKVLEENINECGGDISSFLRHYRLARYKYVSKKDLFKEVKAKINEDSYDSFLQELVKCSCFYKVIINPHNYSWEDLKLPVRPDKASEDEREIAKIYQALLGIEVCKITQFAPIFLSFFNNYETLLGLARPTKVIQNMEKFGYAFFAICSYPARAIETECAKFAEKVWTTCLEDNSILKTDQETNYNLFNNFLRSKFPTFDEFKTKFKNLSYKKPLLVKYTLQKISNKMQINEHKDDLIDYNKVTIEHILPQKPDKWGLTEKDIEGYVNNIGNLTIIGKKMNSSIGNDIIEKKIEEGFKNADIVMTKEIVKYITENNYKWDQEEIDKRSEQLCRDMYNIQTI